jgi:Ca2+-transporting ATPase
MVSGDGYAPTGQFTVNGEEIDPKDAPGLSLLLKALSLCSDAFLETSGASEDRLTYRMLGDPTEGALVVAAAKAGYWRYDLENSLPRVAEIPFDSIRKRMTTIHKNSNERDGGLLPSEEPYVALVKGAPDEILGICSHIYRNGEIALLTDDDRKQLLDQNASLASQALRLLGGAVKGLPGLPQGDELTASALEEALVFVGLVGMIDPPRPEVKPAVGIARKAGIKTVMITGDYPETAMAIAREINLLRPNGKVLTGRELEDLGDNDFADIVDDVDVYARVSPQHKVRIVEALQARRHIVSMTGDGVNDAPALKRADIGVAMGITGTDVSKEAAVMVLTDDNYASIVAAIEEGRIIYSNIRKFVFYLLSANVGEIMIILVATLLGWPLPLMAIHLLVLNLITDGAPALALGMEKGDPDIMANPPRHPDEPVINRPMTWRIIIQGIVDTIAILTVFRISLNLFPENIHHAQTIAFATLSISELLRAYTARSENHFVWQVGIFTNRYMQYAVLSSLLILLAIIYVPVLDPIFSTTFLTLRDWLLLLPFMLMPPIAAELTKIFLRRIKV